LGESRAEVTPERAPDLGGGKAIMSDLALVKFDWHLPAYGIALAWRRLPVEKGVTETTRICVFNLA
jgi:hypothetical protein